MNDINSNLFLKSLAFTNISVKRALILSNNIELNGSFDIDYKEIGEDEIIVTLKYNAKSINNNVDISVEMQGDFVVNGVEDENAKRYLLHVNSLAIMFPYLRSQVSIATTQPGFMPIQIPIVNAIALARAAGFKD